MSDAIDSMDSMDSMDLEGLFNEDLDTAEESGKESEGALDLGSLDELDVVEDTNKLSNIINDARGALLNFTIPSGSSLQKTLLDPTLEDPLYESVKGDEPVATVLNLVLLEIVEEICFLKACRNTSWDTEQDYSDISSKRVKSLKGLVEALVEKERIKNNKDTGRVDFHSKNFENVFSHFLGVIKATFDKVSVPKQYEDIFFTQLAKDLDGFERDAEKIYYGKK